MFAWVKGKLSERVAQKEKSAEAYEKGVDK